MEARKKYLMKRCLHIYLTAIPNGMFRALNKCAHYLMVLNRSTFEVDATDLEHPLLQVETVIDGQPAYQ